MTQSHDRLTQALEEITLSEYELEQILFYVKLLVYARRGRIIPPPTPEQWRKLPSWLRWKILIIAIFWAKVYGLQWEFVHWL